jgi:hypothetical protein
MPKTKLSFASKPASGALLAALALLACQASAAGGRTYCAKLADHELEKFNLGTFCHPSASVTKRFQATEFTGSGPIGSMVFSAGATSVTVGPELAMGANRPKRSTIIVETRSFQGTISRHFVLANENCEVIGVQYRCNETHRLGDARETICLGSELFIDAAACRQNETAAPGSHRDFLLGEVKPALCGSYQAYFPATVESRDRLAVQPGEPARTGTSDVP